MAEVVFPGDVALGVHGHIGVLRRVARVAVALDHFMGVALAEPRVAHDHQFDEEEYSNRHEDDSLHPAVLGDWACEAFVGERLFGGSQKMNECSGYDNSRPEVLRNEESPAGDPQRSKVVSENGEYAAEGRRHQDDEHGRYTQAHATVIFVSWLADRGRAIMRIGLPSDQMMEDVHCWIEADRAFAVCRGEGKATIVNP